jgi:transmembrane 9 superfamily protein 2/4
MREPRLCQIVCMTSFTQEGANDVKEKIDDDYRINM